MRIINGYTFLSRSDSLMRISYNIFIEIPWKSFFFQRESRTPFRGVRSEMPLDYYFYSSFMRMPQKRLTLGILNIYISLHFDCNFIVFETFCFVIPGEARVRNACSLTHAALVAEGAGYVHEVPNTVKHNALTKHSFKQFND